MAMIDANETMAGGPSAEASVGDEQPSVDAPAGIVASIVSETMTAVRQFRCMGAERLTREGISVPHLHAMWLLQEHGDLSMSRLAEMLGVSLPNATGLIDRMEERGLVERVRVPDDRRLVLVRLTPHGTDSMSAMDVVRQDILERLLTRLDPDQLIRMREAFRDLTSVLLETMACSSVKPDVPGPWASSGAHRLKHPHHSPATRGDDTGPTGSRAASSTPS